jgi:hypothetical protein
MATDRIVEFYSGGQDDRGRTLDGILGWSDDDLEAVHDYIQWVFPTPARSAVNPSAPLVTGAASAAFRQRAELRARLTAALDRMLAFYGLSRHGAGPADVSIAPDPARFRARAPAWLHPGNHNHLRLTRIIQSLDALGLPAEARGLQRCLLEDVYDGPGSERVSRETYEFWVAAVRP